MDDDIQVDDVSIVMTSFVRSFWINLTITTHEFNVNFMKFIVFERTHEVRWNECFCSCPVSGFFVVVVVVLVDYCHPPFKSIILFHTSNDIDFNFINKTVRLSHIAIKYLEGWLCTNAHMDGKMAKETSNGWWNGEWVLCWTSIIKLDKIDIQPNKFDRWNSNVRIIFEHLHFNPAQQTFGTIRFVWRTDMFD